MSASRQKKARFLAQHPFCCFCGGTVPTASIDHVPSRTCFPGRHGPDTFEFPACDDCQNATRKDEIAFSLMVRLADHNRDNYDKAEVSKALAGMANNLGNLLPNPFIDGVQKRQILQKLGIRKPIGMANSDIPILVGPAELNVPIRRYSMKIISALFYREKKRPIPLNYVSILTWGQVSLIRNRDAVNSLKQTMPYLFRGARPNLDFGDRFGYRFNKDDNPDMFGATVQFGKGLWIAAMIAPPEVATQLSETEPWKTVGEELAMATVP